MVGDSNFKDQHQFKQFIEPKKNAVAGWDLAAKWGGVGC